MTRKLSPRELATIRQHLGTQAIDAQAGEFITALLGHIAAQDAELDQAYAVMEGLVRGSNIERDAIERLEAGTLEGMRVRR